MLFDFVRIVPNLLCSADLSRQQVVLASVNSATGMYMYEIPKSVETLKPRVLGISNIELRFLHCR